MYIGKIQGVLIAAMVVIAGIAVYAHFSADATPSDDQTQSTVSGDGSNGSARQVTSSISDSISVNNPNWGYVQIMPDTYTGTSVTYEAIAYEGCSFVAWMDTQNRYIELSTKIDSSKLDPSGTVATFTDQASSNSKIVSYGWKMPTFETDSNGRMQYQDMTYPCSIYEEDYNQYKNDDVYREAVLGNVYLTPWQLVADDPAVEDIVEYLKPLTSDLSNLKKAWVVMSFVQDVIDYKTDSAQYGSAEYWAYPIETMYSGYGDCEDTAIMFCAIGSKLGLDTGLVSFSYSDTARKNLGHMGAAVALVGNENVTADNNPVFTYKDTRYCYVETATDSRLDMGYLLKYPDVDAYIINDGGFTHITYSEEQGFGHDVLVSIGTSYDTHNPVVFSVNIDDEIPNRVYGDDFTNPPTISMKIGDTFSYIPATNLPCTFSASGDGLSENNGPFTFNAETYELSGKVTTPGTYHVTIKAETTGLEIYQVAYQYITFEVGESELPSYGGQAKTLSFVNGSWNIDSITLNNGTTPAEETKSDGINGWYIVGGLAVVIVGVLVVTRL